MTTPEQLEELIALSDVVLERIDAEAPDACSSIYLAGATHRLARAAVLLAAENGRRLEQLRTDLKWAERGQKARDLLREVIGYLDEAERGTSHFEVLRVVHTLQEMIKKRLSP